MDIYFTSTWFLVVGIGFFSLRGTKLKYRIYLEKCWFLGAVAKLQKSTSNFVMLSVRIERKGP
jgi:hypothetical protein